MSLFKLAIHGKPHTANKIYQRTNRGNAKDAKYTAFIKKISLSMKALHRFDVWKSIALEMRDQCVGIELHVYSPKVVTKEGKLSKNFGDCDNFLKPLLDSIYTQMGCYDTTLDDSQVTKIVVEKFPSPVECFTIEFFKLDKDLTPVQPAHFIL